MTPPRDVLAWASGRVPTPQGFITVAWHREPGSPDGLTLALTVPPNATATLQLAASNVAQVTEGGRPLADVAGVRLLGAGDGTAVVQVGAGTYRFRVR